ncbi:MAG: glycosyltransferase family 4 protein [Candidatus Levybacteria bacterium]|nr:glycosyltransferase family 4 protein [Candidatus Levybacteria bacterium]
MKTIIYLHPHFTISGGAGKFVLETGKRLSQKGYIIIVISIKSESQIVSDYKKYINFIDIGGPLSSNILFWLTFPISYLKVAKILNKYKDFILFPQVFPSNWWAFTYKLFHPKIKMVWMCQEPSAFIHSSQWINAVNKSYMKFFLKLFNPILSIIDKKLAVNSDYVFANSYFTRDYAKDIYKFDDKKIKTIYLGADLSSFKKYPVEKKENQILSVCRLTKFKNLDVLINAIKIIMQKGFTIKVKIVGDGEEKRNLMDLVKELKLNEEIVFIGNVPLNNLIKLYQRSKIFISCSVNEPFGLAAVESMSCGTPVIAVNSGGLSEIVKDKETGFLIQEKRPDILADKIIRIITDNNLLKKMSNACVYRSKFFTWDKTVEKMTKFI